MDKNNVLRTYSLRYVNSKERPWCTIFQESRFEGEFGPVIIHCWCNLEGSSPAVTCVFSELSGTAPEQLYAIRNSELAHFIINILPLFNPLTFNKNALSFQEEKPQDL